MTAERWLAAVIVASLRRKRDARRRRGARAFSMLVGPLEIDLESFATWGVWADGQGGGL